jgi:hypothetical protein
MITYTWTFPSLTVYPELDGQPNVVFMVYWRLQGTDEAGRSAATAGAANCTPPLVHDPFTPFEGLTPTEVQTWVEESIGEEQLAIFKRGIESQIQEQIAPTQVNLMPPWIEVPMV